MSVFFSTIAFERLFCSELLLLGEVIWFVLFPEMKLGVRDPISNLSPKSLIVLYLFVCSFFKISALRSLLSAQWWMWAWEWPLSSLRLFVEFPLLVFDLLVLVGLGTNPTLILFLILLSFGYAKLFLLLSFGYGAFLEFNIGVFVSILSFIEGGKSPSVFKLSGTLVTNLNSSD